MVFHWCSLVFIGVHWCSIGVHWCSLVFHWCSLVFIGVPLVFIGVHWCSIGVVFQTRSSCALYFLFYDAVL